MSDTLLMRGKRGMLRVPAIVWKRNVRLEARRAAARLEFMGPDHHRIWSFVVTELPRTQQPLSSEAIAAGVGLEPERVGEILDELEEHLTFVYRRDGRNVDWAYPVTAEETPHRVTFDNGERFFGAWGIDAVATPFVQGRLRGEDLEAVIDTECAHCGLPIRVEIDSNLDHRVQSEGASPLVCTPFVDVSGLSPNIIDGFWRRSLFFWSEEHARDHSPRIRGAYWTLTQAGRMTRAVQSALFAFPPK